MISERNSGGSWLVQQNDRLWVQPLQLPLVVAVASWLCPCLSPGLEDSNSSSFPYQHTYPRWQVVAEFDFYDALCLGHGHQHIFRGDLCHQRNGPCRGSPFHGGLSHQHSDPCLFCRRDDGRDHCASDYVNDLCRGQNVRSGAEVKLHVDQIATRMKADSWPTRRSDGSLQSIDLPCRYRRPPHRECCGIRRRRKVSDVHGGFEEQERRIVLVAHIFRIRKQDLWHGLLDEIP